MSRGQREFSTLDRFCCTYIYINPRYSVRIATYTLTALFIDPLPPLKTPIPLSITTQPPPTPHPAHPLCPQILQTVACPITHIAIVHVRASLRRGRQIKRRLSSSGVYNLWRRATTTHCQHGTNVYVCVCVWACVTHYIEQ